MTPTIAYVQLQHFFALVEARQRPALQDHPFVVTRAHRIIDVSPRAARFNITTATGLRQARLACPHLQVVEIEADPAPYVEQFRDICASISPRVEPEQEHSAFIDLTGWEAMKAIVEKFAGLLRREMGFPFKMGIAPSKLVAKIACLYNNNRSCNNNLDNNNYCRFIPAARVATFLAPLPVTALWPWPARIHRTLQELGIYTIGELARVPVTQLQHQLGEVGEKLHEAAQGIDREPVQALYPPQVWQSYFQIPAGTEGCHTRQELTFYLQPLIKEAATWLHHQGKACKRLQLFACFRDNSQHRWQREISEKGIQSEERLQREVYRLLFARSWPAPITSVRLLLDQLEPATFDQLVITPEAPLNRRQQNLQKALSFLERKFGPDAVQIATDMYIPRREQMLRAITELR